MKTILKIAWRNVWRNKARSIVIILAVGFGLWGGIFSTALINGMMKQQFDSGIKNIVSHLQIHHPDYLVEKEPVYTVSDAASIVQFLENHEKVAAFTTRARTNGMLATASMTSGVEIYGIDPMLENQTTALQSNLVDGDYFEQVTRNPVLIGEKLADKMKISTGSRIIITFQDLENEIVSAAFRVCGVYKTSNTANDERNLYVKQADLDALLGGAGTVNEIAVLLHELDNSTVFQSELKDKFPGNEIRTWFEVSPELSFMTEFSGFSLMILLIIILFAMAFGLLNTMLMTIYERTRELGVLMSVGMNKIRVFSMIVLETSFLVLSGSVFGSFLGGLTVYLSSKSGLDISAFGGDVLSEYGFSAIIYPTLEPSFFFHLAILVLITAILSALYPAYKALKLNPAEAVRKE
ncbi:MAG: FtsX-like permease family protein [Paludibacter sp.]|nr:FtsX-like permease family protein [Paludibacter sp.]